jgi:hypothetical protein
VKLLNLLHVNEFEILAPQCPTHYTAVENGDLLDILMHKNVLLSDIVSGILDSAHLPIVFHLLHHIRTRNLSDPVDIFTDWDWFQSLASELFSPGIEINFRE